MIACGDAAYGGPRAASADREATAARVARPDVVLAPFVPPDPASPLSPVAVAQAAAPIPKPSIGALERPQALRHFFDALAGLDEARAHEDVNVVQFGDSHTAADYETGPLRRALQARFGDGGRGFVSVGRPWRFYVQEGVHLDGMSGWTAERGKYVNGKFAGDGMYGLVGVSVASSERGARAWTDLSVRATRIELAYLEQPQGGSMDLLIDGVWARRIATRASAVGSGYVTAEVTDAPHHVELQAIGDGEVRVFGMSLDRSPVGVTLDALGVNGARVSNLLTWDEGHFSEQLRHRGADLVVLAYGTNESSDNTPPDLYERQLVDVLGRVGRAVPAASCLLLGPPDRALHADGTWTTAPRLYDIIASQRRVAEAAGCAYYSQLDAMGGAGSIAAWAVESPPRAMLDRTHLSREGYAELGDAVARDLVAGYEAWRAAAGRPAAPFPSRPLLAPEPVARFNP
jgi:lysophospholipase L1-like esterase